MKDFGLDFGLLIAYLVPGALALWGFSYVSEDLQHLYLMANAADGGAASWLAIVLLSLMIGMVLSLIRVALIDRSFLLDLRFRPLTKLNAPWLMPVARVEPMYGRLANDARLAAYLEAKASEKRPYQFYGNTLVSLFIAESLYLVQLSTVESRDIALLLLLVLVGGLLYVAARTAHARFMKAVADLNRTA